MAVLAHCLRDNDNMMVCYYHCNTDVLVMLWLCAGSTKHGMFGEVVDDNNIFSSGGSKELCSKIYYNELETYVYRYCFIIIMQVPSVLCFQK